MSINLIPTTMPIGGQEEYRTKVLFDKHDHYIDMHENEEFYEQCDYVDWCFADFE